MLVHPNMATMLSGIFTDAHVSKSCLDLAIKHCADRSFNAISIDGDTSTNDTFVVLANGQAKVFIDHPESDAFKDFCNNLSLFATELSSLIVRDGEGATKFIKILVKVKQINIGGKNISRCKNSRF